MSAGPKREHSVHVRLSNEAMAMLDLICAAQGRDKAATSADLLERVLLGEAHALRVAALRLARAGFAGIGGDR